MQPPNYQINLDLPPRERHREICTQFREQLLDLEDVFTSILSEVTGHPNFLEWASRKLLRKVFSAQETEEIRGKHRVYPRVPALFGSSQS